MIVANSEDIQELINSTENLVLYFSAAWCVPCRTMSPLVQDLSKEHPEITVAKVSIEDSLDVVNDFSIKSVPVLLFFKNGTKVGSLLGQQVKRSIEAKIQELLATE